MRTNLSLVYVVVLSLIPLTGWADRWAHYECIEIHKFDVDREDYSSKKAERAATIPDEILTSLQHKIVGELTRANVRQRVKKQDCAGKTLVFGGKVTDFKRGSRAARIFIGLGAGKQKFAVQGYLRDKSSGSILDSKKIIDRKVGGLAGGDEDKGQRDFAEKVVTFIKQ